MCYLACGPTRSTLKFKKSARGCVRRYYHYFEAAINHRGSRRVLCFALVCWRIQIRTYLFSYSIYGLFTQEPFKKFFNFLKNSEMLKFGPQR